MRPMCPNVAPWRNKRGRMPSGEQGAQPPAANGTEKSVGLMLIVSISRCATASGRGSSIPTSPVNWAAAPGWRSKSAACGPNWSRCTGSPPAIPEVYCERPHSAWPVEAGAAGRPPSLKRNRAAAGVRPPDRSGGWRGRGRGQRFLSSPAWGRTSLGEGRGRHDGEWTQREAGDDARRSGGSWGFPRLLRVWTGSIRRDPIDPRQPSPSPS